MQMTQQQAEEWARIREKGRPCFIWMRGVLSWGLSTAILWSIGMGLMNGWAQIHIQLPLALVLFPIGGYFWGAWMWRWCNNKYLKAMKEHDVA